MLLNLGLWGDAVKADAQTHHIHLSFWETGYTRGVENMATEIGLSEEIFELLASLGETTDLQACEIVHCRVFATGQMGKDGADLQWERAFGSVGLQSESQCVHLCGVESQTVHTRIEFDMDRVALLPH